MSQITIQCQCKKVSPNSETWETSIFFPRNSEKKKCWERKREKWMLDVGKESPGEITREREQFIFDIIFKCRQCPRSFFLCLLSSMRKNWLAGFCFFFFLATSCGTWDLSSLPRDQTFTSCIGSAES